MILMPWRYDELKRTFEGLKQTQEPLIATDGNSVWAAGCSDDKGLYYFVPKIANFFNLSLDSSIDFFLGLLIFLATTVSFIAFFHIFKNWIPRIISFAGIFLIASLAYQISDVYVSGYFASATIIPIFMLMSRSEILFNKFSILAFAMSGVVVELSNFIRYNSGVGVLLFVITWLLLNRNFRRLQKCICLIVFFGTLLLTHVIEKGIYEKRDSYLATTRMDVRETPTEFPFWHLAYIGLGYLENDLGIHYSDRCGYNFVHSCNPDIEYLSPQYNSLLKNQFLKIISSHFAFFLNTVLHKLFVLMCKATRYLNYGLLFLLYLKIPFRVLVPYILGACFCMIPGVVVVPENKYVLGMLVITTLFAVYVIGLGLEKYWSENRGRQVLRGQYQ